MKKINIELSSQKYEIIIGKGLLSSVSLNHKLRFPNSKAFIVG